MSAFCRFKWNKCHRYLELFNKITRHKTPTLDPFKLDIYHSPWAVTRQEEDFFKETVKVSKKKYFLYSSVQIDDLGYFVGDDVKLGTLFMSLVLVTPLEPLPGVEVGYSNIWALSQFSHLKLDSNLVKLLLNLRYLTYRYLSHKFGSQEVASTTSDQLMR